MSGASCSHPWLGAMSLFSMRGQNDVPYRAIVAAFEHYRRRTSPDTCVTAAPSRACSARSWRSPMRLTPPRRAAPIDHPLSPADVLQEMRHNPGEGWIRW